MTQPLPQDVEFLEHFGVKGMRWGVRKAEESSPISESTKTPMSKKKKAAIVLGSAAVATAIAVGAIYAKRHMNVSVKDIPKTSETVKKFAESMAKEPLHIAHSSRGRDRGYTFLRDGGFENPTKVFADLGLAEASDGFFKRFGSDNQNIAARFLDPEGRHDIAGRPIGHDVILPRSMTQGVRDIDDVVKVAWPHIKDVFAAYYRSEKGTYGPGF